MPSGRFLPLLSGMQILLSGAARYPFFLSLWTPSVFLPGDSQISLSVPGVSLPLFSVTRLTAKARPENERVRMNCSALTSLGFPSLKAFTIRTCRRRTFRLAFDQSMVCQAIGLCRLVPAASLATPNLRTPVQTSFPSYLVMKDHSEVCSLSGRGMLFYRSISDSDQV